jgi:outer membrane protein OmpA-like peptidoglycan-associated protein
MRLWKSIPYAAVCLLLQAQYTPAQPNTELNPSIGSPATVPLYRVTVVQGTAKAINYRDLRSTTKIDMKGTVLLPQASGVAKVQSEDGKIEITAKFKKMPPASTFGGEFLTYVLWGISTEGRATNLGELILKNGKGKIEVTEKLQTFGLVVTAEPYFAVSQPSNVVVLENAIGKDTAAQLESIDAKYELLRRGQYTLNLNGAPALVMDEDTPFVVYQARNAVRIAQATGASSYASEAMGKAEDYLRQSENQEGKKDHRIMMAREAVQRSEDARLISIQKQDAQQLAMDQKRAQDKVDEAKSQAASATMAQDAALRQTARTEDENDALRSKNEGLRSKNADLHSELKDQLNAVLETRATARGLIVNMSGVLFQTGKSTLLPAAREKLSKIAGILSAHKGLKIEADGFTDSKGTEAFNQRLSEQRAANTKNYPRGCHQFQGIRGRESHRIQ